MGKIKDPNDVKGAVTVKPIPKLRNQVGPTCGLYALSIVAHYWNDLAALKGVSNPWQVKPEMGSPGDMSVRERLNQEIIARAGKTLGKPANVVVQPSAKSDMLQIASSLGSRVGEVFDAETLAMIARQSGLGAFVMRWKEPSQMLELLKAHIDMNIPCIMAYDNTDSGGPGATTHGTRPHWCVIFGYVNGTQTQLLTMHGWGSYYLWNAGELERSNSQVDQFGSWGTWYKTKGRKADPLNKIPEDKNAIGFAGPSLVDHSGKNPGIVIKTAPTAVPTALPHNMPRPDNAVASFQISHELDLKHQIVIVTPSDISFDTAPPKTKSKTATVSGGGGTGQRY